jgi:hypothetical protein
MGYSFFITALNVLPSRFPAFVIEDVMSGDTELYGRNERSWQRKLASSWLVLFEHYRNKGGK